MRELVVVGGNLAGLRAVEALRREGHDGRITLIGDELELPYDRTPLSKDVLTGSRRPDSTFFRTEDELAELNVDLRLGAAATRLRLHENAIELADTELRFDGLIVATGAAPRTLVELEGRTNVLVLRTLADARRLLDELGRRPSVLVVGAGVIGSEVAASARALGLHVEIIESAPAPMVRSLGPRMGIVIAGLHAEYGTTLRAGVGIEAVEGNGRVDRVRLTDGSAVEPDMVVVGIGVTPNTAWLEDSGLSLRNGIICDETLNAGHPAVYAAGDVVNWPNGLLGERVRLEQWTNAAEQARHAARNILAGRADAQPFVSSNYFWSVQYGHMIQFVGSPDASEVTVVEGRVEDRPFVAWYRRDNRLVGALGIDSARLVMKSKLLIERRCGWDDALAELEGAMEVSLDHER